MHIPIYDMLWISYDNPEHGAPPEFNLILPYCEVANGEIEELNPEGVVIRYNYDQVTMEHKDFVQLIEREIKNGRITHLMVQMKGAMKVIQIPTK
jgi:hypothetical protein